MNNFQRSNEAIFQRANDENQNLEVEGYALKFDKPTIIMKGTDFEHEEVIAKGSISREVLKDVVFNKNHDNSKLLARTLNDSLKLEIDDVGLKIKANIIDNQFGRDTFAEIKEGLIQKMSFAWSNVGSEWEWHEKGEKRRRVFTKLGKFVDVSAVTFPAYDDTSIESLRANGIMTDDEIQDIKQEITEKRKNDEAEVKEIIKKIMEAK